MESVLLKLSKSNKQIPTTLFTENRKPQSVINIVNNKPEFNLETVSIDYQVEKYPSVILSSPKRNDIIITLKRPVNNQQTSFVVIKDISASKKYCTHINCDEGILIDNEKSLSLSEPYESVSLLYNFDDGKFYIY
jgi:hypothetical protein